MKADLGVVWAWVAVLLLGGCAGEPVRKQGTWRAFGVEAGAEVYATTDRVAASLLDDMQLATARVEAIFDPGSPTSELSRLNAGAVHAPYAVRERDLYRCTDLAVQYAKASDGTYDPTVGPLMALHALADGATPSPRAILQAREAVGWADVVLYPEALAVRLPGPAMALDLTDMAPGYALDVAARLFARIGSRAGLLRIGAVSRYAWGGWAIELDDPRHAAGHPLVTVHADSRGVAVTWERDVLGRRRIDPRTGEPASSDVLVAITLADSAADAGAFGAAMFVGGSLRAGSLLTRTRRVEAVLLVEREGRIEVLASASLQGALELSAELQGEVGGPVRYLLPPAEL